MLNVRYRIQNKTGLHARPASQLVELSKKYDSKITIITEDDEIDAKSIISVLAGGISAGMEVTIQIEGPDEKEASAALSDFMKHLSD